MALNFTVILSLILFINLSTLHTDARSLLVEKPETTKQGNGSEGGNGKESVGKTSVESDQNTAKSKEFGEMKNLPPFPNIPGIPFPSIPGFPYPSPMPGIPVFRRPFDNIPGVPPLPSIPNLPPLPPLPNIPFPFLSPPPA
ncbi:hypothetical protein TIFTF001_027905 [Ficus carica]|uniref:Uncharacterized protein n=1 Tax=Ficus carica TaxID=3494 RepID=A0AA88DNU4_FICCA|nr:hypothetical protein TIFTF001_027905 [Ficus carica]